MKNLLVALTVLLLAAPAFAQRSNRNTLPPACSAANLLTTCVPQIQGVVARVFDAASGTVCTGGGSTTVTCEYNGSNWRPVTSGTWIGANGESIANPSDGLFRFTRDESGAVTITVRDDSNPTDFIIDSGTTGSITVGSADTSAIILRPDTDVQIINGATGVVTLDLRDYADTDDDDMAHSLFSTNCGTTGTGAEECDLNISITTGGANIEVIAIDPAGGFEVGDATTTAFTVTTDGAGDAEAVLPENSIGPDEVAIPMQSVLFCGELGAATDEFFAGPHLEHIWLASTFTDVTFASTVCDTLGDTTVASADNDIEEFQSYKVNGMYCQVSATPGAASTVMTFVDDTTNTPVTCSIAAAETSCTSVIGTTTDVAANSQVAVSSLNATDDESLQDVHCLVYISWK